MSHTPGPWRADGAEIYAESLEWVAEALNDQLPDGGEANATLIAWAPDLLDSLEECVKWLDAFDAANEAVGILRRARAIIRKARGE